MLGGRTDGQTRTPQPSYIECKPIQIRLIENSSKEFEIPAWHCVAGYIVNHEIQCPLFGCVCLVVVVLNLLPHGWIITYRKLEMACFPAVVVMAALYEVCTSQADEVLSLSQSVTFL